MPVCEKKLWKKKGKYGEKGEPYFVKVFMLYVLSFSCFTQVSMNKKLFISYIQNYLIHAIQDIITKLPEVKVAVVQCDQAGGHRGGRSEMKKVIAELNEFGKPFPKPIHFITQCSW